MRFVVTIFFALISFTASAQLSVGLDVGFTMPTDQYHKPEGRENYGLFLDPRPGYFVTFSTQRDWVRISAYFEAGFMQYRTYDGIGPFLNPSGVGFEPPTYGQMTLWNGTYFELGVRKTVYEHRWANVEVGLGGSYSFDIYGLDNEWPYHGEGFVAIPGSVYFEQELDWLTPHSFMVTPHVRFWRTTKKGHRMWLKGQYSQGLNKKAEGVYDIYYVDTDNTRTYGFSFDVVFRNSFYNITLGYALFPDRD